MENNLDTGRAFEWDDVVQNDGEEFEVLPECDCDFEVKSFERGRYPGGEKIPPCNKAILKIKVTNAEGKSTTVNHSLLLHSKCEGLICAFFTAIGQRKHGEQLRMNWNTVVGSKGRCRLGIRTFKSTKNGEDMKTNEIKRFYEPADARQPAPAAQAAPIAQAAPQQTSFGGGFGGGFTGGFGGGFGKR